MAEKLISPAGSFKGWKFTAWLKGNVRFWEWFKSFGKLAKEIIKLGVPLLISALSTKSPAWTAVWTVLGKFILDSVEFWFKEIPAK